jgi:NADH-quinone oxidoreductase subunit J
MEFVIFLVVAAVAIAAAVMVVLQRNAMYSALFLVLNFFCLAVFYVLLGAYFLAVVQVAVYAGAIMVLMLFVIMLLNVAYPEPADRRLGILRPMGILAAVVLLVELVAVVASSVATGGAAASGPPAVPATPTAVATVTTTAGAAQVGHTQLLASELFTRFLLPFEVTSILLLGAILGAAVLARKRPELDAAGAGD